MNSLGWYGERCLHALQQLRTSSGLEVVAPDPVVVPELADPGWVLDDVLTREGFQLPDHPFRDYCFPAASIQARWHAETDPYMVGEFCLSHIHRCLTEELPGLDDPALTPDENELLGELRVIDQEPYAGSGRLTGILLEPGEPHEIWLYDMSKERLERLDVDYGAYLENVLVTKGAYGWQYLFADVDFKEPGLRDVAEHLSVVLRTFPEMFPDHSYDALQARLEARL